MRDLGSSQDVEWGSQHIMGSQQQFAFTSPLPDTGEPHAPCHPHPTPHSGGGAAVELEPLQDPFQPEKLSSLGYVM